MGRFCLIPRKKDWLDSQCAAVVKDNVCIYCTESSELVSQSRLIGLPASYQKRQVYLHSGKGTMSRNIVKSERFVVHTHSCTYLG